MNRVRFLAILASILLVAGVVPAGAAPAPKPARSEHQRIVDFWTVGKIKAAKSRDFTRNPVTGKLTLTPSPLPEKVEPPEEVESPTAATPMASSTILAASWNAGGVVKESTGKVFFQMGGGYFACTASVATDKSSLRSIILTAAHCAYDNAASQFAANWLFIPDYDAAPASLTADDSLCAFTKHGCWTASSLVVHRGYTSQSIFNETASRYDFAFAVVGAGGKEMKQLDATFGSHPINYSPVKVGVTTYLFGYPQGAPYTGIDLVFSRSALGTDPRSGDTTYRVSSKLTEGSSGGPWFNPFTYSTGTGTMFSVNSYGYANVEAMHGPKFNVYTQALYNAAKTSTANKVVPF